MQREYIFFIFQRDQRRTSSLLSSMNDHRLRRAASDGSIEMQKLQEDDYSNFLPKINEVDVAECNCCGLVEDCTEDYINRVKASNCGKWVCGLCSEAVKEGISKAPSSTMEEAISSHKDVCDNYNKTTRLNPKLSLACELENLAKRSFNKRSTNKSLTSKIARSSSCFPRIDLD
ncbi:hypothetical protein GIB67_010138 [Kingdonia uniflora]|uniref:Uncharacterized protein n=1 Tax=Kingdonia uniflora TaxID=39325 RepID=A0A7J7NBD6_9MAGN|nr:hypothetical protein GIB67_010138 [Kingdonia uniflora]